MGAPTNHDLASFLGVSTESIRRWARNGLPVPRSKRGLTAAYRKRVEEWRAATRRKSGPPKLEKADASEEERLRLDILRTRHAKELDELRKMRGELLERTEVDRADAARATVVRDVLMLLPRRFGSRYGPACEQELRDAIDRILVAFSTPFEDVVGLDPDGNGAG